MADEYGNTLGSVFLQRTGFVAVKFDDVAVPSLSDLQLDTIPTGYQYVGLLTSDGGYAEEVEVGDSEELFQAGYEVMTGDEAITGKFVMAESNGISTKLSGFSSGVRKNIFYPDPFSMIISTTFKNGHTLRMGGIAQITGATDGELSRGGIYTHEYSFKWLFQTDMCGYYRRVTIVGESGC